VSALPKWALIGGFITALVLLGAVRAPAFWATEGSGTGTAAAETVAEVKLTPGTPTTALFPGGSGDVAVSIVNDNTYQAFVGSLVLDTSRGTNGFSVSGGEPGCDTATVSYTTQSNGGTGWFVLADSTLDLDLANAVDLGTAAASECQGANFVVYLLAVP
jgi:hypothetical protein